MDYSYARDFDVEAPGIAVNSNVGLCNFSSCVGLAALVGETPLPCDHRVPPTRGQLPYPSKYGVCTSSNIVQLA